MAGYALLYTQETQEILFTIWNHEKYIEDPLEINLSKEDLNLINTMINEL